MLKSLLIPVMLVILSNFLQAQEIEDKTVKKYNNAKIKLTSGEIIQCKNLTIKSSNVDFTTGIPALNKSMKLDKIEKISTPTKRYAGPGLLIGAAVGGVAMLIAEKIYEDPESETTHASGYGWTSTTTTTITKEMAPGPKIAIVAGGAAVGALIGSAIKGGWKKIYPDKNDNLSFNISSSPNYTMLNLQFAF